MITRSQAKKASAKKPKSPPPPPPPPPPTTQPTRPTRPPPYTREDGFNAGIDAAALNASFMSEPSELEDIDCDMFTPEINAYFDAGREDSVPPGTPGWGRFFI